MERPWKAKQRLGKKLLIQYRIAMHTVVVLALDGVLAFDLSTPVEVFGRARLPDGRRAYAVRVCAPSGEVDANVFALRAPWSLDALAGADTIIVPGLADPMAPISEDVLGALRGAVEGGTRIASICVGAFTLAAAGLLDGRRATTHWAAAGELSRRYPDIEVDDGVLFVDNGQVLTSAGAAAVVTPVAVSARDHDPSRRAHLTPGRFQFPSQLPRPIQGVGRHQPPGLQARLPGIRPDHPLKC